MGRKKKSKEISIIDVCEEIMRSVLQLLAWVYMFLVIVVMPFYNTNGFAKIGTNKYEFFKMVTTGIAWFFIPSVILYLICLLIQWKKNKAAFKIGLSVTDKFALLYGVAVIISYLVSDYQELSVYGDAWQGAYGWYMGARTQLTLVATYFGISRCWKNKRLLYFVLPVVVVVFGLGYLNRFGVYPIEMEAANPQFISTIGNINWYCGYLVTVFFAIIGFWLTTKLDKKWQQYSLLALMVLGFGTLVTQGSASGIFVLVVMVLVLYLLTMREGVLQERFWLLCSLLFLACCVTLIIRKVFSVEVTYQDGLMDILTATPLPVIFLVICAGMYFLVHNLNVKKAYPVKVFETLGYIGAGMAILLLVGYIFLLALNTLRPGSIGPLSNMGAFIFDAAWATNRGATFRAGMETFLGQDIVGKLFGVGPDCMSMYIHTKGSEELSLILATRFNTQILTNAHCEWLTVLANTGIVGAVGYIGMVVSAIVRFIKAKEKDSLIFACGLGLLAFTINNVFSFQQAMNTTTMFLVLGAAEALQRQSKNEK
ncbi:MAG: hypothetical protein IJ324_03990 [Lachnospiraceae bacterium]|nr:hypothetical protein [Lachnospiraceae bacterium]